MKNKNMNVVERTMAPTPKWFKILRTVGIALASVGGAIIASPVALPVGLVWQLVTWYLVEVLFLSFHKRRLKLKNSQNRRNKKPIN